MFVSLHGANLKVKRANKHIQELESLEATFIRDNMNITLTHLDESAPGKYALQFGATVCSEVSAVVGDAAHNLRSALDVMVSRVVDAHGGDGTRTYFPMNNDRKSMMNSREYVLIKAHAPVVAQVLADQIKPYSTGGNGLFSALNKLDRMDKHRTLIPLASVTTLYVYCIDERHRPRTLGPGTFIVLPGGRPPSIGSWAHAHNERNGKASLAICFGEGEPFQHEPIIPTLFQLSELVANTVAIIQDACR